jgi:hypothetical protein
MRDLSHPRDYMDDSISDDLLMVPDDMLRQTAEYQCRKYNRLMRRVEAVIDWANATLGPEDHEEIEWIRLKHEAKYRG